MDEGRVEEREERRYGGSVEVLIDHWPTPPVTANNILLGKSVKNKFLFSLTA
jgi:hypothetical protein